MSKQIGAEKSVERSNKTWRQIFYSVNFKHFLEDNDSRYEIQPKTY